VQKVDSRLSVPSNLSPTEIDMILGAELRGICLVDAHGTCRYATAGFSRLLGYERDEIVGSPIEAILQPFPSLPIGSGPNAQSDREVTLTRKDGSSFPARISIQPLAADEGSGGFVLFVQDMTEEKHVEDLLRKTEKLASAGRMAAAIAHEINNPLEAVTNLLYLMRSESLTPQAERYLSLLETEIERVSRIARQTLAFYREKGKPGRVDLRELLNIAVDVHATRNPAIRVHRRYRTSLSISGFASEMQQVFHNLIGNAIDAGATELFLHTRSCTEKAPPRRHGICITIGDNGTGIDPSVRGQLFHPFITTKGESGTGLGLWTSRGIIVHHEGSITVRTSTDPRHSGTCFQIFLPR
jgi:PAS domain S-box-containing protein